MERTDFCFGSQTKKFGNLWAGLLEDRVDAVALNNSRPTRHLMLLFKYLSHSFSIADMFNFGLLWMLHLLVFMQGLFDSREDILSSQYDIMRRHLCFC